MLYHSLDYLKTHANCCNCRCPLESVPRTFHLIDTQFSHQGYFFHDDNARLAIIPTLVDIQQGK